MHDAFGDESCGQEYVTYGVLLVHENQRSIAEKILGDVKASFGGEPDHRLHCRQLFAGDARNKTPWARLRMEDVFELYSALMDQLRSVGLRRLVTIARKSEFPDTLPAMRMQHVDPSSGVPPIWTKEIRFGDKQIAAHCAQGTIAPLSKNPGLENVRFWADPDSTLIDWYHGKRMATKTIDGFVGIAESEEPARINVMPIADAKPSLLEVADCIAYVAQRSRTNTLSPNGRRFRSLHQVIAPEEIKFAVAPDGGFRFSIPNTILRKPVS